MAYFLRLKRRSTLPDEKRDTEAIFAAADGTLKHMDPDGNVTDLGGGGNGGSQPGYIGPFTIYGAKWQAIDATGEPPDAGTFKLSYGIEETAAISWDATQAEVAAALDLLPTLTGKVTEDGNPSSLPGSRVEVILDDSLAPFEILTVSNNSLTASAAPVADPLVYVAAGTAQVDLLTPEEGDVLEDFVISVPSGGGFGSGSAIYFAPESGDADWPNNVPPFDDGLLLDSEDGSDNWTVPSNGDAGNTHSVFQAITAQLALDTGAYPTLPCVCITPSVIQANLSLSGQGTGGLVKIWVKMSTPTAPS